MSPRRRPIQVVLRALWVGVIPALLAALALKFLVPFPGPGFAGALGKLARSVPIPFGVVLFFAFTLMARYWMFRIPGGRYASTLPAHVAPNEADAGRLADWADVAALSAELASGAARRHLAKLEVAERTDVQRAIEDLGRAIDEGRLEDARALAAAARTRAAAFLAARRARETWITVGAVAAAAAVALGVRATLVESYRVESASMVPNFEPDDRILGKRVRYAEGANVPAAGTSWCSAQAPSSCRGRAVPSRTSSSSALSACRAT